MPERILLIQLQKLGDVLLTSALLEDLRQSVPEAGIDFLTTRKAAELLRGNPFVSEVLHYDPDHASRAWRQVRARRYQWIFDVQSSPRTAPLVLLSGARRRVGWNIKGPWASVYTDRVPRAEMQSEYVVRERQQFLERLGVPISARRPHLYIDAAERERGELELHALPVPAGTPRVGMVLSSGANGTLWPADRFAELASRLDAGGITPVVLDTGADEAAVAYLRTHARGAVGVRLPEMRRFLGFLSALDLFVSADTGPAHMATALDVPTVTVFGPTDPRHWSPGLSTAVTIASPRALCKGCARGRDRGSDDHTCMLEVDAETVYARVLAVLAATASRRQL